MTPKEKGQCHEGDREVCKLEAQIRRAIDATDRGVRKMEQVEAHQRIEWYSKILKAAFCDATPAQVIVPRREIGQTVREYFAAHAPSEPRWKFDVQMDTPCPDGGDYADGALLKWYEEKERREFSQWPWVWADAVLRAKTEET